MIMFLRGGSPKFGTEKYDHLVQIIRALWPDMHLHRWLERSLRAFCKNNFTGICGAANSAKSYAMAIWGLISWWVAPLDTLVFVVSTNLGDAERRVWGHLIRLHQTVAVSLPGTNLQSLHMIALRDMPIEDMGNAASAIALVAAGDNTHKALRKLQGSKNKRVVLICDEMQDVSPSIQDAMYNLRKNPHFEFRCAGNPSQTFDFHGRFCEPTQEMGGHMLDYEMLWEWPIRVMELYDGTCVHFNSVDSPNFDREAEGLPLLPYLPMPDDVRAIRALPDARSRPEVWRQEIGVWPKGVSIKQTVFTDEETILYGIREKVEMTGVKRGMGIDPAWVEDGDDYVITVFELGSHQGKGAVFQPIKQIIITDEIYTDPDTGIVHVGTIAKAKRTKWWADQYAIHAAHVGIDVTGAIAYADMLDEEFNGKVLRVGFGESASDDMAISIKDDRVGKDLYLNRATELWRSLHAFAEHGQLRGISDPQILKELTLRKYNLRARGKEMIESKGDFKKRIGGKSPDRADSLAIGLSVAIRRMGAIAGLAAIETRQSNWTRDAKKVAQAVMPARLSGTKGYGQLVR